MSDYENDEWESAELAPARSIEPPVDFFNAPIGPKGYRFRDVVFQQRRQTRDEKFKLSKAFEPTIQRITPTVNLSTAANQQQAFYNPSQKKTATSSYKRWQQLPLSPDHTYEIYRPSGEYSQYLLRSQTPDTEEIVERINGIGAASEAHLRPKTNSPEVIEMWGTQEQCQTAVTMLDAWQLDPRASLHKHKQTAWSKEQAQDGRKKHRQMEKAYDQYKKGEIKESKDQAFPFEAYLIWPSDFDLDVYLRDNKASTLPAIAEEFCCRFRHERSSQTRYTKIQAREESELLAAYQRLIGLSKEMLAHKVQSVRGNLFLLPSFISYKNQVVLTRDAAHNFFKISTAGDGHGDEVAQNWAVLAQKMESKTWRVIRESIEAFIKSLHGSQKFIRLRVTFGDLSLKSFPRSKDGSDRYPIDEFLELTQNARTRFSESILQAPGRDMADLVGLFNTNKQLALIGEAFQVCYDFQKPEGGDIVRLEMEMERAVGQTDVEIRAQRWVIVKASKDSNFELLSMKVLALDGPSFAIQANSSNLHPGESITREMHEFWHKQTFQPGEYTFTAYPRRRTVFPPGQQGLISIKEKSILKFRFKETDGTLELSRDDLFSHGVGLSSNRCSSSTWAVCYYYLGWDSLLNEFANIKAGEDVSWERKLTTFFPPGVKKEMSGLLPNGFRSFWKEARELQDMIRNNLSQLPHMAPSNDDAQGGGD